MSNNAACPRGCSVCRAISRRRFVTAAAGAIAAAPLLARLTHATQEQPQRIVQHGPASKCVPSIRACFVRRKGEYGMRWPGQIYDGHAAREKYTAQIIETAKQLGVKLELRGEPIYSDAEADQWLEAAEKDRPDGLLLVLLDRQEHAWPTAGKAIGSGIPTVVFSPVGSSFTTNTAPLARKVGGFIASTDDFAQVRYGMKMLAAGAKMRATRCLVIAGSKEHEAEVPHLGISLRYIPAKWFLEEYEKTPTTPEVLGMANALIGGATKLTGATEQDVINGIKSYVVARTLLERHQCDAITMDCLGALGRSKVSLPCIAWSKMNDDGVPAACEADIGAVATHVITQYLFDRPGFQQDPVAETAREALIGAHCSCPTRLGGFGTPPEPYDITHHHGLRDATARPVWKIGQRVTCCDVLTAGESTPPRMIISAGSVLENVAVPPAGGCVVSVMVKLDGVTEMLDYPGFHQLFLYGDFKRQLAQFCQLFGIKPELV